MEVLEIVVAMLPGVAALAAVALALLVYRLAVGATVADFLAGWSVLPKLLVVTLGSVVLGFVPARIRDVATAVVVQFCTTFGVWELAERLHLSRIVTMAVFATAASPRRVDRRRAKQYRYTKPPQRPRVNTVTR